MKRNILPPTPSPSPRYESISTIEGPGWVGGAVFCVLLIVVSFCFLGLASGEGADGKALLIKGKNELDAGRYAEAIESLSAAYKRLPVVGDYILFWLSNAYKESGNIAESDSKIKELLKGYTDSPLRKKARSVEIKNLVASNNMPHDLKVFESYIKDYPEDYGIKFLLAQLLKNNEAEKAKTIFKNIYISSEGIFSKMAYNELTPSDITLQDLIEKASNLINAMEFKEAESILRGALLRDDGQYKVEILKKLGHSLFKQKRYKESAEIYEKAGDYYSRAKALYKAGEKTAFDIALKKLTLMGDRRTGSLLILVASDKRRDREIDEALSLYKNIKAEYPSEAENSLWGIGWTYYRSGNYQEALDVFTDLYKIYGSSKYLYWKAQSLERLGKVGIDSQRDADHIYRQLAEREQDFYGALARIKISQKTEKGSSGQGVKVPVNSDSVSKEKLTLKTDTDIYMNPRILEPSVYKSFNSERIDILMELGMKKDAVAELSAAARKATNPDELVYICSKLQEAGEYRLAINLASRLPYRENSILYPLAHWAVIKEASARYMVDPFIVLSVMREESRFDPEARSAAGALGLMQLMPQTAHLIDREVNLDIRSLEQIYDIKINITLGSYYINSLIKEFESLPAAIAAYNAGEGIVRKWQGTGNYKSLDEFIEDIPYDETKNFAKRVITTYFEYLKSAGEKDMPRVL